jgi:hypothetical protein
MDIKVIGWGDIGWIDLVKQAGYLLRAGFFLGLFVDTEYGGDMFLRNVR